MSKPTFNIFAISDPHIHHEKIIELCHRPFLNIEDQDTRLTSSWNCTIRPEDLVIILGDFVWTKGGSDLIKEAIKKLNGRKILVKGNHDKKGNIWYLENGLDFICDRFVWDYNGKRILFVHDPSHATADDIDRYEYILHGHCHNNVPFLRKKPKHKEDWEKSKECIFVNLSVENTKYRPMALIPLLNRLSQGYYEKR
jgi:calcineurin-like phosphoesterase family protein